jgi:hypothetical protein
MTTQPEKNLLLRNHGRGRDPHRIVGPVKKKKKKKNDNQLPKKYSASWS